MNSHTITLEQLQKYRSYLMEEERSEATIKKYIHDVTAFYNYLSGERIVTKDIVIEYKNFLINNYKTSSINSMLAAVNGLLEFMGVEQYKVKRLKVQRRIYCDENRELTKSDYFKLLSAASKQNNQRLYMILQTICGTGIRVSELEFFTVKAVKEGKVQVYCKDKVRTVFIPAQLRNKLLVYISKNDIKAGYIFVTKGGKAVDRSNIWTQMQKISEMARVVSTKVFPHNLRHLFARTYYNIEKDITKLADILGHSSIETTRIYMITSGKEHEKQLGNLGLVT